jgi:thermitase
VLRRGFTAATAAIFASVALAASASAAEYVPEQVIVKFQPGTSIVEETAVLSSIGAVDTQRRIHGQGAKIVRVPGDAKDAAAVLSKAPVVKYAEVDKILTAQALPNDTLIADQYALDVIEAPEGWDAAGLGGFPSTGGAKVGIVDTGIDNSHPEFAGRISDCAQSTSILGLSDGIRAGCSDVDGHGTKVAGILGARANNGIGVAGVAFNSPLAICRALEDGLGRGSTSNIVNCIYWLRGRGAQVISMSFGGGSSVTLHNAMKSAWNNGRGAVLVAAAGNHGGYSSLYPAAYPEVISVASTDAADGWWDGSNRNADVELAAPGVDILTTELDGGYAYGTGTSAATPYAAGVAAVMRTAFPGMRAVGIRYWLGWATDDLGDPGRDAYYGFGRVNLCRSITGGC